MMADGAILQTFQNWIENSIIEFIRFDVQVRPVAFFMTWMYYSFLIICETSVVNFEILCSEFNY